MPEERPQPAYKPRSKSEVTNQTGAPTPKKASLKEVLAKLDALESSFQWLQNAVEHLTALVEGPEDDASYDDFSECEEE